MSGQDKTPLCFKEIVKLRPNASRVPFTSLAISHKYGVIVLSISGQLHLVHIDHILSGGAPETKQIGDIFKTKVPSHVLASTEEIVAVGVQDTVFLLPYTELLKDHPHPLATIKVKSPVVQITFNPTDGTMVAILSNDGNLRLSKLLPQSTQCFSFNDSQITCISFSPKGKQICAGHKNGEFSQLKMDLTVAKKFAGPGAIPLSVVWVSTPQFIAFFRDGENVCLSQIDLPKGSPPVITPLGDVFVSDLVNEQSQSYFSYLNPDTIICSSTTSGDIVALTKPQNSPKWVVAEIDDQRRPALPIDTYSVGGVLYYNYTSLVTFNESEVYSQMPVYIAASKSGTISAFSVVNNYGLGEGTKFIRGQILNWPSTGVQQQPSVGIQQEKPLLGVQQQQPVEGIEQIPALCQQQQQSLFGFQPLDSGGTELQKPLVFGQQQQLFGFQQQPPIVGITQPTSSQLAQISFTQTPTTPFISSESRQYTTPILAPTTFSFSPVQTPLIKSVTPLQPLETRIPQENLVASDAGFERTQQSTVGSTSPKEQQITSDISVTASASQNEAHRDPVTSRLRKQSRGSSALPSEAEITKVKSEIPSTESWSEDLLKQFEDLQIRITNFQEVRRAFDRDFGEGLDDLDNKVEVAVSEVSKMEDFCEKMKKTCDVQTSEVNLLRDKSLMHFSQLYYAKSLEERNKDPRYLQLLRSQPMDPSTLKSMRDIENLARYIRTQIQECRRYNYYSKYPPLSSVEIFNYIKQTLATHDLVIKQLRQGLENFKKVCTPRSSGDLDELTEEFQKTSLESNFSWKRENLEKLRDFSRTKSVIKLKSGKGSTNRPYYYMDPADTIGGPISKIQPTSAELLKNLATESGKVLRTGDDGWNSESPPQETVTNNDEQLGVQIVEVTSGRTSPVSDSSQVNDTTGKAQTPPQPIADKMKNSSFIGFGDLAQSSSLAAQTGAKLDLPATKPIFTSKNPPAQPFPGLASYLSAAPTTSASNSSIGTGFQGRDFSFGKLTPAFQTPSAPVASSLPTVPTPKSVQTVVTTAGLASTLESSIATKSVSDSTASVEKLDKTAKTFTLPEGADAEVENKPTPFTFKFVTEPKKPTSTTFTSTTHPAASLVSIHLAELSDKIQAQSLLEPKPVSVFRTSYGETTITPIFKQPETLSGQATHLISLPITTSLAGFATITPQVVTTAESTGASTSTPSDNAITTPPAATTTDPYVSDLSENWEAETRPLTTGIIIKETVTPALDTTTSTSTLNGTTVSTYTLGAQAPAVPIFGQPLAISTSSVFGVTSSLTTTTSAIFGQLAPAVTVTTSLFDQPNPTSPISSSTNLFGQPASPSGTTSIFGNQATPTTTPSSIFGQQFTTTQSPTATSIFGQTPRTTTITSSIFAQPTNSSNSSIFGQSTATTTASSFGQAAGATSTSIFGQQQNSSSIFGGSSTTTTAGSSPSLFGQSQSLFGQGIQSSFGQPATTVSSIFGGQPSTVASSTSLFGQPSAAASPTSLFGQPAVATSIFGQPAAAASQSSIFGQSAAAASPTSMFGQPAVATSPTSLFGQQSPSVFGQSSTSVFGQQQQSAFGQLQTAATTQASPFGATFGGTAGNPSFGGGSIFGGTSSFGGGAAAGSLGAFGSSSTANSDSLFGSTAFSGLGSSTGKGTPGGIFGGGSSFGQSGSTAASIFGQATSPFHPATQSAFGAPSTSSAFGSLSTPATVVAATPIFGGTPVFGSPAFGTTSFGGAAGASTFGSGSSSGSSIFGGASVQQGTIGFGQIAQQGAAATPFQAQNTGFGFGSQQHQQQQSPSFGGSSFSSWR